MDNHSTNSGDYETAYQQTMEEVPGVGEKQKSKILKTQKIAQTRDIKILENISLHQKNCSKLQTLDEVLWLFRQEKPKKFQIIAKSCKFI